MMIRWCGLASVVLFLMTHSVHAALIGTEQITNDISADARNQLINVTNKHWVITDDAVKAIQLEIEPVGAFKVVKLDSNKNIFDVQLMNPGFLLDARHEILPLKFIRTGDSDSSAPSPIEDLGVSFTTSTGYPLDLAMLQKEPEVKNFKLSASPSGVVEQIRIEGNSVYYKRMQGRGLEEVVITLEYVDHGVYRKYSAILPTRDDGYRMRWMTRFGDFTKDLVRYKEFKSSYFDHKSGAQEDIVVQINGEMYEKCYALKDRPTFRIKNIEYIPLTELHDLKAHAFPTCHRGADDSWGCWTYFGSSGSLERDRKGGFCKVKYEELIAVP